MQLKDDHLYQIPSYNAEKKNISDANDDAHLLFEKQLQPFTLNKSPVELVHYAKGRKGFVAPKEWKIKPNTQRKNK